MRVDCPICKVELRMTERQGIEIDYCPQCRGIWLDRGELDKLVERSAAHGGELGGRPPAVEERDDRYPRRKDDDDRYDSHPKRKRKSFLGEIFDFD